MCHYYYYYYLKKIVDNLAPKKTHSLPIVLVLVAVHIIDDGQSHGWMAKEAMPMSTIV